VDVVVARDDNAVFWGDGQVLAEIPYERKCLVVLTRFCALRDVTRDDDDIRGWNAIPGKSVNVSPQ
jgi:hypothetical protein